jgi:hypothetical protein
MLFLPLDARASVVLGAVLFGATGAALFAGVLIVLGGPA